MGTVTLTTGEEYTVYGEYTGDPSFTKYARGSLVHATTFAAATPDNHKRALNEATRVVVLQPFEDETYADPTTAGIPQQIIDAVYELALAGLADASIFTTTTTAKQTKRLNAKGVEIEYFGPREGGRLPGRVAELLAPYLAGTSSSGVGAGSYAAGVDGESAFDSCDEYGVSGGG